jgi:hypothetical protein
LYGAKIAGCLVNDRGFRSPQRVGAVLPLIQPDRRNPLIDQAGVLTRAQMARVIYAAGNAKYWIVPQPRSSQVVRLVRASDIISNCTSLPVFCWTTVERSRMLPPLVTSPILIFTKSQPRSLLSIANAKPCFARELCAILESGRFHACSNSRSECPAKAGCPSMPLPRHEECQALPAGVVDDGQGRATNHARARSALRTLPTGVATACI